MRGVTMILPVVLGGLVLAVSTPAQENVHEGESGRRAGGPGFHRSAASAAEDLDRARGELAALRDEIAGEKIPLTRRLSELENAVVRARAEFDEVSREIDSGSLNLTGLQGEIQGRESETGYLAGLFDEYARNFESRVHISELHRYRDLMETARREGAEAGEGGDLFSARISVVEASIERLTDLLGGTRFEGTGVGPDGRVTEAHFALVGPVSLYASDAGEDAGLAEQVIGSLEPRLMVFDNPALAALARSVVTSGEGMMPLDPSLGGARKIDETRETLAEHVMKGGPVMIPILLLSVAALVAGLSKWIQLARMRTPSRQKIDGLLEALRSGDFVRAARGVRLVQGPTGEMLAAGMDHIAEPKALVEEVMFERMLGARLRLQSMLTFIQMCAAAAPLLGLLGTVTGIINTFRLITVFGTGDAKTLSSGISEALITTEFGLIVAIPSLLLHAYLSRKARRFIDQMEKTAVSFLNRIPTGAPAGSSMGRASQGESAGRGLAREPGRGSGDAVFAPAGAGAVRSELVISERLPARDPA